MDSLLVGLDGSIYAAGASASVYKFDATGEDVTLHSFTSKSDGRLSIDLGIARDGNFIGTTCFGGDHDLGTIFKMTPDGEVRILHSFAGNSDGACPNGVPFEDEKGNVYGTTESGGKNDCGTIFKVTPRLELKTLHSFAVGNRLNINPP